MLMLPAQTQKLAQLPVYPFGLSGRGAASVALWNEPGEQFIPARHLPVSPDL